MRLTAHAAFVPFTHQRERVTCLEPLHLFRFHIRTGRRDLNSQPPSNFIIAGRLSNLPASPKRRESFYERVKKSGRQESVVVTVRLP